MNIAQMRDASLLYLCHLRRVLLEIFICTGSKEAFGPSEGDGCHNSQEGEVFEVNSEDKR